MSRLTIMAVLVVLVLVALGCRGDQAGDDELVAPAAKIYYCPDHPAVTGGKGDRCPDCTRALVERPRQTSAATTRPDGY